MADILQTQTQMPSLGQMPSLPLTKGLFARSTSEKPDYITAQEMAPALEESRKAKAGLVQQMDQLSAEQQQLENKRNIAKEEEKLRLRQDEARLGQEAPQRMELQAARNELKNAAFVPSKDNARDLATMFSLVSVIGMALGGEGKISAFNTMGAMNGMLEGYQKGRADVYKREKDVFEKNLKVLQNKVTILQSELQDALQTYRTNRELGEQKAEIAFAKAGSKIGEVALKKQGLVRVVEYVDGVVKDTSTLVTMANKQVERAEDMAFNERKQKETERANQAQERQREAQLQEDIRKNKAAERDRAIDRQQRRELELAKANTPNLKPSAKIQEGFIADNQLKADLGALRQKLQDPKLAKQIADYRAESFFSEEGGRTVSQLLQTQIPTELRQFLTQVRDMRNNYYRNISGLAVTNGEALRSYGTVPQPGDTAAAMLDKIDGMERRVGQKVEIMRYMYGLPNLDGKLQPGGRTSLRPGEDYSIGAQDQTPAVPTQRAMLRGREIVVRNGKWVFSDTGEDAK